MKTIIVIEVSSFWLISNIIQGVLEPRVGYSLFIFWPFGLKSILYPPLLNSKLEIKLHFKGLVTISGQLSDKIFIVSHFIENTKDYLSNIAYRLYFQKIVGFPIVGTLEMGFSDAFVSKNTSKSPISHDKIPCPTSHNDIFCLNDGHLGVILDLLPLHIPRRT